jgi:hypothetical protein
MNNLTDKDSKNLALISWYVLKYKRDCISNIRDQEELDWLQEQIEVKTNYISPDLIYRLTVKR